MNALLKPLEMGFRPMVQEDVESIVRIERASYPYPWTLGNFSDCLQSGYSCWTGEIEGRIAGYWLVMFAVGEGHILNCCVAPAWRGRRFGIQLMEHLMQVARGHQTEALFLEVRPSNIPAVKMYERMGFETIAQRRHYYPSDEGREDALIMRRLL
ncbi:MAG: ribosomal protein S18-alanine N-acetyltransferase [Betaproteobacteria bacterium]|nr:ribosomal protein S18-alanine N-acetyltransferase [Betaproteobacteria bacterium]